jgi:peptide/nickel transport system permease protein
MKGARFDQLRVFWGEFRRVKSGLVGVALLVFFVLLVVLSPVLSSYPEADKRWRDMTYWLDSPREARPIWVNWFTSKKYAVTEGVEAASSKETVTSTGMRIVEMEFPYEYKAGRAPSDIVFRMEITGRTSYEVLMVRPDGKQVDYRGSTVVDGAQIIRLSTVETMMSRVYAALAPSEDPKFAATKNPTQIDPMASFFGKAQPGVLIAPENVKGTYTFKLKLALISPESKLSSAVVNIQGGVSGLLGTDNAKRDLWSGVVAGTKWALMIGLLTSLIAVAIGVVYGVAAGYFGGWIDALMNRIYEVFTSIPLLPILIVMSAVFKPSIWIMIMVMCVFFWTGPVKTVRSIALQIKENAYIEAARGLGASHGRILFKHMVPQLIPFAFASMALSVPGAIIYEATISLIGLGDATVVTWGQILRDAFGSGAVLKGIWWWVVPPGLAIAVMGMTFAFIGFAMDTILNPRLKTR